MSKRLALTLLLACAASAQASEPVAQVRVAFDRDGITASRSEGFADLATRRAVTADDPVRIASISKLVLTLGVMRLVEEGRLDLDEDVSRKLGYTLRNPDFKRTPITLRLLLSHRSSLTDAAGYWQVPLDGKLQDLLANPKAWDSEHKPGTFWRYTNLNFPVVASVMEKATGERFDLLMQRLVLEPLQIPACYGWTSCDEATAARAVVQYADGKPIVDNNQGRKPACSVNKASDGSCDLSLWKPGVNGGLFGPQGGLRISANGLAKIGRLLLNEGSVDGVRILSPASVREMLTPHWTYAPGNGLTIEEDDPVRAAGGFTCRYGLSAATQATKHPDCGDDPFGDGIERVGHSGNAYGLLSGLWIDRASGTGVTYFSTGNDAPEPGRHSAYSAIEERQARGE